MKKGAIVVAIIAIVTIIGISVLQRPHHQPISVSDVSAIVLWKEPMNKKIDGLDKLITASDEIDMILKWFNSATDIRKNKDFAEITSECGINIVLKSGETISILNSGEDFVVQRYVYPKKKVSYWAKQTNMRRILSELEIELKDEITNY